MRKHKAAQHRANLAPIGAPKLVNIVELSQLKNVPVRSLRTMLAKGVLSHFRFGHRTMMFSPEQFDKDITAFNVKSRFVSANKRAAQNGESTGT
jgi:hypothetical protein